MLGHTDALTVQLAARTAQEPQYKCRNLEYGGDQACKTPIGCPDANAPAGWAILNSIVGIERTISNLAAITSVEASVSDQVPGIVATFGNIPDGKLDAILGMASLGLGFLGTPGFADLRMNNLKSNAGEAASGLRDAVTNLVGQSTSIVKQTEDGNPTAVRKGNSLTANVQGIIRLWEEHSRHTTVNCSTDRPTPSPLFSTSSLMEPPLWLIDRRRLICRSRWSAPYSPSSSTRPGCLARRRHSFSTAATAAKPETPPPRRPPLARRATPACVNGKAYYLTSAPGTYYTNPNCYQHPVTSCTPTGYKSLPGQKSLDGKRYGNITIQEFVAGSVNTWNSHGQQNGVGNGDGFAAGIVGQIYDNPGAEFQIPGVFGIPVCKDSEAQFNWKEDRRSTNFPCNPPPK